MELIATLVTLGILATIGLVAYSHITDQATIASARAELRTVATTILTHATTNAEDLLDRDMVLTALEDHYTGTVTDGLAADTTVYAGGADYTPTGPGDIAVGFTSADNDPITDNPGTQAVVVLSDGLRGSLLITVELTGLGPITHLSDAVSPATSRTDDTPTDPEPEPGDGDDEEDPEEGDEEEEVDEGDGHTIPPAAITRLTATPGSEGVQVTWDPAERATSYTLTREARTTSVPTLSVARYMTRANDGTLYISLRVFLFGPHRLPLTGPARRVVLGCRPDARCRV